MEEIAGRPYWRLSFDSGGAPTDQVADQFISEVAAAGISDLFVFSHGWGNSASSAQDLYSDMFPRLEAASGRSGLTLTGYAGVFWPSIWFPDPAPAKLMLLPAGQGGSNPGMVDAALSGSEIAQTLAQFYAGTSNVDALNAMGALIDEGQATANGGASLDVAQQGNVAHFHTLLQGLVNTTITAPEDNGEAGLISSTTPVQDYARIAQVMGSVPAVAELGLGDLGNVWNGAKDALRIASYYEMKGRAGDIGSAGLGPRLERLHTQAPAVRVHLIGHSFGGRLVSYALSGISSREGSPVASLSLVQCAFSHWSFTPGPNMPWGDAGALSGYADRVLGARVSTFTQYDWAVGQWYPRASFLSHTDNSIARQLTGAPSQWGGLGADGYQGVDPCADLDIQTDGAPYSFQPGQFYRINAEAVINDTSQSAFAGAHSDIRHDEVANLILAAATSNASGSTSSIGAGAVAGNSMGVSGMGPGAPIMASTPPAPPANQGGVKQGESGNTGNMGRTRKGMSFWLPVVSTSIAIAGLIVIIIYGFATPGQHTRHVGIGLMTAFASLCAGSLFGFLFGVPRLVSSGELRHQTTANTLDKIKTPGAANAASGQDSSSATSAGSSYMPSTNLAEVSDWLTKLLLGAGLVQLTRLGGPLGTLDNAVAAGLGTVGTSGPAQVMAGAIMVTYIVIGFLDGYIVTTLWYTKRIDRLAAA